MPKPPLLGRVDAAVAAVDGQVIVAGGLDDACPPGAACVGPETDPFADGAVLDLATQRWRSISDAPDGFWTTETATVDGDVYVLAGCHQACGDGQRLYRYRTQADSWDVFPPLPQGGSSQLIGMDDGVVALADSDEAGEVSDYALEPSDGQWRPLPDDPLPPVYDRRAIAQDGELVLFGSPIEGSDHHKLAASYDWSTQTWARLRDVDRRGFQVWLVNDRAYLNPHFSPDQGGVFDLATHTWSALPEPPSDEDWTGDMAGVIGHDTAHYALPEGWALDLNTTSWIRIPTRPTRGEVWGETVTAVGTRMVVFGGHSRANGEDAAINETWLWSP